MDIKKELLKLSDNDYKVFNEKLCPDTKRKLLGIRIPLIRELAKKIIKNIEFEDAIAQIKDEYFEEVILKGFIIAYYKINFEDKIEYVKSFIPLIDSWEISDTFVPSLKIKDGDLDKAWNFILPYTKSTKEFDVRFAVVMMLDYFITDEYIDKVIIELDMINHDGYYARMAIAWCLAEIRNKIQ